MNPYKKGCDGMMKVRSPICRVENKGRVGVVSIDGINIVQDFEEKKFRKTEKNWWSSGMINTMEKLVTIRKEYKFKDGLGEWN